MAAPSDTDDLFQRPLTEFTAARNALAATLTAAGRMGNAAAVKALPKPPLSAWTVNQLYWRHRKTFDQFMATDKRLGNVQASQLAGKGGELRAPIEAHRAMLREIIGLAAALIRDTDHIPTPELTRRITTTLEALAASGSRSSVPPDGRLSSDVDPPGFDVLAALVPRKGGRARGAGLSRVIHFRQRTEPSHPKKLDAAEKKRQRQEVCKARSARAIKHAAC